MDLGMLGLFKTVRRGDFHPLAIRLFVSGVAVIKYTTNYLPSGIHSDALAQLRLLVPALGLLLCCFIFFYKRLADRFLVFLSVWSLFILWLGLSRAPVVISALASLAGAFAAISFTEEKEEEEAFAAPVLMWSSWAGPGSLCSATAYLAALFLNDDYDRIGLVLWIIGIMVIWLSALSELVIHKKMVSFKKAGWRHVSLVVIHLAGPLAVFIAYELLKN
jgi:hypothetical protein